MQNRLVIFFITTTPLYASFFFFNDTATTEIYTLSLHDALPISGLIRSKPVFLLTSLGEVEFTNAVQLRVRSEEHTSELQSRLHLVCRLLLEKKNYIVDRESEWQRQQSYLGSDQRPVVVPLDTAA